jgi:hypothetical protein
VPAVITLHIVTTTLHEKRCAYNPVNYKQSNNYPNGPSTSATGLHISVQNVLLKSREKQAC